MCRNPDPVLPLRLKAGYKIRQLKHLAAVWIGVGERLNHERIGQSGQCLFQIYETFSVPDGAGIARTERTLFLQVPKSTMGVELRDILTQSCSHHDKAKGAERRTQNAD